MSLSARYVLPRLTERARLVPLASGVVLEVGIGSALNLPFYGRSVEKVYGVDPSRELWGIGQLRVEAPPFPVELLSCSAERIPLDAAVADSAVSTWTLCTIADPGAALREIRRVLKPAGHLLFIEHGQAPDAGVEAWQNRLTPIWKRMAGGCHMNRKIDALITQAGFRVSCNSRRAMRAGPSRWPTCTRASHDVGRSNPKRGARRPADFGASPRPRLDGAPVVESVASCSRTHPVALRSTVPAPPRRGTPSFSRWLCRSRRRVGWRARSRRASRSAS
jgi:SAM-dependent methyltransferase